MESVYQRTFASWTRNFGLLAVALALWFVGIEWPIVPAMGLDPSWQTSLVDAHVRGRQFGTEVQFTYGPWGFLCLSYFVPEALDPKIVWELLGRFLLGLTVVLVSAGMLGPRRWLFLAASVVTACFFETSALVLITLQVVVWLLPAKSRLWQRVLAVGWLSFLAHQKFLFCILAAIGIALSAAAACADRRWRAGIALLAAYAVAYVAWWLAAGQHLVNLPLYWRRSWEISEGYSAAMFIDPPPWPLVAGLAVVALVIALLWWVLHSDHTPQQRLGTASMLACGWLFAWKEAFTRADLHVFGFFVFSFLMALALFGLPLGRRGYCHLLAAIASICLIGTPLVGAGLLSFGPLASWHRILNRPREILGVVQLRARFARDFRAAQHTAADQELQSVVGRGTIDALTIEQGLIFLNGLNYDPRPVIQSYSAYTPELIDANSCFFQSARAPEFVIIRLDAIDGHPPAQDDGLVLADLARHYKVAQVTLNYTLLRRTLPDAGNGLSDATITSNELNYGDEISVPDGNGHPVWMAVDFRPTLLGRARTFFYHSTELRMVVTTDNGQSFSYRILPGMSSRGFFIWPWLRNHADFAALVRGDANAWVRSVRFEFGRSSGSWFWEKPRVRFASVVDMPLRRD